MSGARGLYKCNCGGWGGCGPNGYSVRQPQRRRYPNRIGHDEFDRIAARQRINMGWMNFSAADPIPK